MQPQGTLMKVKDTPGSSTGSGVNRLIFLGTPTTVSQKSVYLLVHNRPPKVITTISKTRVLTFQVGLVLLVKPSFASLLFRDPSAASTEQEEGRI